MTTKATWGGLAVLDLVLVFVLVLVLVQDFIDEHVVGVHGDLLTQLFFKGQGEGVGLPTAQSHAALQVRVVETLPSTQTAPGPVEAQARHQDQVQTSSGQRLLAAVVVVRRLSDVPGRQRQRVDVVDAVELQHVHVAAVALVPGDEAAFTAPERISDDVISPHLIIHTEEQSDPPARQVPGVGHNLL